MLFVNSNCHSLNEKLASAEEMRRSVYAITHHSYGGAYTAAISQLMFSVIAQTSTDVHAIFGPLLSMQLGGKMLSGLFLIFNSYVNIRALLSSIEEANYERSRNKIVLMTMRTHLRGKIVRMAQIESKLMALLASASLLADELLSRAATKRILLVQAIFNDDL
ncbi:hypothetical protein R6Q57_019058 [Mikania cordata]